MSNGLRVIKESNNLAEWSRQVEECRSSGLSVRAWCEQTGIAVSTFHYRQKKVWDTLQQRNQFVEVSLPSNEYRNESVAATVHFGEVRADIHNGAVYPAPRTASRLSDVGRTRGVNSSKRLRFFPKSSVKDLRQKPVWITATSCMTLRQESKI